ncbi:MAG TPA: IPT/TIG domain-containing protein [Thermoanaerobaculia bacterium]|jgi:hypothetical protein
MRYLFAMLTLLSSLTATAAPQLLTIAPRVGFTYGVTRVELRGSGFTDSFNRCEGLPADRCPVKVFFGDQQAAILYALPEQIIALAPPQADGRAVTVRVQTESNEVATSPLLFVYDDDAKPAGNYRQYLVPLAISSPAGAHGSIWRTELMVHNGSPNPLLMYARFCNLMPSIEPCDRLHVAPVRSELFSVSPWARGDGAFIYVPEPLAPHVDFKLFARDISREAEAWGTEIPVVRVANEFDGSIRLLDVPVDPRFRANLRVYGNSDFESRVRIAVYAHPGNTLLQEREVLLVGIDSGSAPNEPDIPSTPDMPFSPAYAQLDPLTDVVRASGHTRVRIEVESLPPLFSNPPFSRPIWAFVSLTNNVTQQVTTVTPHRR